MKNFKSCLRYLLLFCISLSSCHNSTVENIRRKPEAAEIERMNRYMIQKDRERIQNYIERKGLLMHVTPTGLWYQILREGEGRAVTEGSRILMEYDCNLLDGTKCYSSEELGPKEIILGRTPLEPGLNEGLKLLRFGSEAMFILPPYMAYGLPGDGKLIPPASVIVYKVNILQPQKME